MSSQLTKYWIEILGKIDRRLIYVLILFSLSIPLVSSYTLRPAEMETASNLYKTIDSLQRDRAKLVLIAMDWGPSTQAENKPQTEVVIEHLMRKRIPFALISLTPYASPFMENLPTEIASKLSKEISNETWVYGKDWVNLGFRPGGTFMILGLAKSSDLHETLNTDANGSTISSIPCMANVKTINDIALLIELTGSKGAFNLWLQYFQSSSYTPPLIHGCTSVTIPEAYNYYVSKQIIGLFEGVAGAAWYEQLLINNFPNRKHSSALRIMTGISVAHLVIICLIILGNVSHFLKRKI